MGLEPDERQKITLSQAVSSLQSNGKMSLLAVRSSSPEEDLEGASFAGGYETSLGVTEAGLETAVRHSFASCLDERVFVYKQEHGFAVDRPRIAVIVQQQIAADASGVAFSLKPAQQRLRRSGDQRQLWPGRIGGFRRGNARFLHC